MTAPFAASLCGFRVKTGAPSTSDASSKDSMEWGRALFAQLQIDKHAVEVADIGRVLETRALETLRPLRPDLTLGRSQSSRQFEQFRHLSAFEDFQRAYGGPTAAVAEAMAATADLPKGTTRNDLRRLLRAIDRRSKADQFAVDALLAQTPQESVLKVDLAISSGSEDADRLLMAISCKWSLRTDRAQDCVAQGHKLANLRRGYMPHFGVLTMEPRPSMLKLLAYGSGTIDAVYHVALPELRRAAENIEAAASATNKGAARLQRQSLERMVAQGRVRSFGDLTSEVRRLGS